ncbi:MAG: 2-aminoethylphosphonate--pyruvate transaminase [Clostridiales Family XIII bacterium]|jgi:2-aminoethylphosphonate-pyruvate transaminase|nr:2-aminoethylphosphonate--pyruvate transaminase [Clostridiales Family XIII bacterium]
MEKVKRNVLLNPGPATTTDTVKYAQVVPDICPREKEFGDIMRDMKGDLVKIVHGDPEKYTAVMFCGSGTVNIDATISSLVPAGKRILIVNNGAYSARGAEVCEYYGMDHINLKFDIEDVPDLETIEKTLQENPDVKVVYACHHETGTGILNPIREIGAIAHKYGCTFIVDTTSTYAMIPIDIEKDNVDFLMASAQKGLMSMTGLSFIIGNKAILEESKGYPKRSYYCNLYTQYYFFEEKGEMHFTPPVQTVYATKQAIKEYWEEGEDGKWARHQRVWQAILDGLAELGFQDLVPHEKQSRLVVSVLYPDDPNWDFTKVHDYCYERGFTIYPGKVSDTSTFRLCCLGTIDAPDVKDFFVVLKEALDYYDIKVKY